MGKASKWFRGLFGLKKSSTSSDSSSSRPFSKEKRRWSFVKSYREKQNFTTHHRNDTPNFVVHEIHNDTTRSATHDQPHNNADHDHDKHAIAVAAATAAVAEAAVAAAQAAAAVVRLTSGGGGVKNTAAYVSEEWAAVKIQSAFRGCLARRALRALKGLVKLQALVRGHIERKRTAEWLHRMQTLMQAQARAIVGRSIQASEFPHSSSHNSSHFHNPGPATPEKFEHVIRTKSRKHEQSSLLRKNSSKSNGRAAISDERSGDLRSYSVRNTATTDDEKSDRVLEIDSGKPHVTIKKRNLFHTSDQHSHSFTTSKDSTSHITVPSPSSYEVVQPLTQLKLENENDVDESSFCTANNSPQFYSAASSRGGGSSRRSPFTPTKSDGSKSFLSGYSDYPNYMSYTESSKAKVRSLSAPKQRPQYERSSSTKRYSIHHGFGEPRQSSSTQRISALHANFMNKAYPGSGRLDKLGMPIGYRF